MKFIHTIACFAATFMLATAAIAEGENIAHPTARVSGKESAECNKCLTPILASYQECLAGCGLEGAGCMRNCGIIEEEKSTECYPPCQVQYSFRNGSLYRMYFFNKDGVYIDYRIGWSAYSVLVQQSDFPVTAAYCTNDDDHLPKTFSECQVSHDVSNVDVIEATGCYIVWFLGEIYTTSAECQGKVQ